LVDEVDQVELASLHVGDVAHHRLEAFGLERRAQEIDGIRARVEHGDRRLASARERSRLIARPHTASTHVRLSPRRVGPRALTAQPRPAGWNRSKPIVSKRRCLAAHSWARRHPARPIMLATLAISSAGSTGLVRWMLKPACRLRIRSSGRPKAVSAIAGILPPCSGPSARSFRISE